MLLIMSAIYVVKAVLQELKLKWKFKQKKKKKWAPSWSLVRAKLAQPASKTKSKPTAGVLVRVVAEIHPKWLKQVYAFSSKPALDVLLPSIERYEPTAIAALGNIHQRFVSFSF